MKLSQEILNNIKQGKPVDIAMIPGHITTPVMPQEVYDIEVDTKGHQFKKVINADKFIAWIEQVNNATLDQDADISEKSIVGSTFATSCNLAKQDINNNREVIDGEELTGFIWNSQAVSLKGAQIEKALNAFSQVIENSIIPVPASVSNPSLPDYDNLEELRNYMSGRG